MVSTDQVQLVNTVDCENTFIQIRQKERKNRTTANTRFVFWLVDVLLAVFAPAFPLSFHDSECSRKSPLPIV